MKSCLKCLINTEHCTVPHHLLYCVIKSKQIPQNYGVLHVHNNIPIHVHNIIPIHVHNIIPIQGISRNLPSQMLPPGVLYCIYIFGGSDLQKIIVVLFVKQMIWNFN